MSCCGNVVCTSCSKKNLKDGSKVCPFCRDGKPPERGRCLSGIDEITQWEYARAAQTMQARLSERKPFNVNELVDYGYGKESSLLHFAVHFGVNRLAQLLLDCVDTFSPPLEVHQRNEGGYNAFLHAAWVGNVRVMNELLHRHNIDVNAVQNQLSTALHLAAAHGRVECRKRVGS